MSAFDECFHNVPMDQPCEKCEEYAHGYRLVFTMNTLTGYSSRWLLPAKAPTKKLIDAETTQGKVSKPSDIIRKGLGIRAK